MNAFTAFRRGSSIQVILLPILSALVVFIPLALLRPIVLGYTGLQLLLNMAIPLSLATLGQMFAMSIGEIDFSIGNLVGLVTCIVGTTIPTNPGLGFLLLAAILGAYILIGALLYWRRLSSIVITIGMSFIWTGLAVTIQPTPGGNIPAIVQNAVSVAPPIVPLPVLFLVVLAVLGHLLLFKTNFGVLVRGVGGNMKAIAQSGHSIALIQACVFGAVGLCGILAGTALAGITTSADANMCGELYAPERGGGHARGRVILRRQGLRRGRRARGVRHDARGHAPHLPEDLSRLAGRLAGPHPPPGSLPQRLRQIIARGEIWLRLGSNPSRSRSASSSR